MRPVGVGLVGLVLLAALGAPWLAPNPPDRRFPALLYAPPTPVHVLGDGPALPFIHPTRLESRLERRFSEDVSKPVPLRWFADGVVVTGDPVGGAPLLLLGTDGYGRDIFARLLFGARVTLALAVLAAFGAALVGAGVGALAGYAGGRIDAVLSRLSEFVFVLPGIYVALSLRAVLPLVLPPGTVFIVLVAVFIALGWPVVARGVRAIVLVERQQDYVVAARAAGATGVRILFTHVLPAARGHVVAQAALLLPAFVVAEATMSFVGLGFPDTVPTWGTMLQEATSVATLESSPWTLAPAGAIFFVCLGIQLVLPDLRRVPVELEG